MPFRTIITDEIMGDAPYRFGQFDAKNNENCVPESFFQSNDCILHYTLGYRDVAGESETTKHLISRYRSPSIHETYTELEWEVQWNESETFLPLTEEKMIHLLSKTFLGEKDRLAVIDRMRSHPGYIVKVLDGFLRLIKKEEPSHVDA